LWRKIEPDEEKLRLRGLSGLKNSTTVFLHDGAKAVRAMRRMVEAQTPDMMKKLKEHPWGTELSAGVHLGWIGGALNRGRNRN
jgi:hypothetical protein